MIAWWPNLDQQKGSGKGVGHILLKSSAEKWRASRASIASSIKGGKVTFHFCIHFFSDIGYSFFYNIFFIVIFFNSNLLFIYLFLYLFLAVLGLRFCAWAFSSCSNRGSTLHRGARASSLSRPLLLWSTGSRRAGSAVVAHGPSCSAACGIFPDQGSNPCPLHWQADSQLLSHQGSPYNIFIGV